MAKDTGFDRALSTKPGFAPALVGKARVSLARGQPAAAVPLLEQAFAQSPLAENAGLLADARRLAGDASGAAAAERELFRHGRGGDGRTLSLYLSTHDRDADEALALAEAETRIRDDIYSEDAFAWALYRKGRLREARAASERALALNPGFDPTGAAELRALLAASERRLAGAL